MDDSYESVLLIIRECYVYKLPPRTKSRGYKAMEWGDMEAFLWKGRLRIIAQGEKCFIRLEDTSTGDLFALCPYSESESSVEPVLDSSRYFVLKVEDGSGRRAFIGMGFLERSEAFDFNVALQDWTKQVRAERAARIAVTTEEAEGPPKPSGPKIDYSLKEGETISINIGGSSRRDRTSRPASSASSGGGIMPLLPPPPSAAQVRQNQQQQQQFR